MLCVCVCVQACCGGILPSLHSILQSIPSPRVPGLGKPVQPRSPWRLPPLPTTGSWAQALPQILKKIEIPKTKRAGATRTHEAPERGRAAVGREDGRNYGRESRSRAGGGGGTLPHHRGVKRNRTGVRQTTPGGRSTGHLGGQEPKQARGGRLVSQGGTQ